MAKLTIQLDIEKRNWTVAVDGDVRHTFPNINGSIHSGHLKGQRALAKELESKFPEQPELTYRIAHLVVNLIQESGLSVTLDYPKLPDPNTQTFT